MGFMIVSRQKYSFRDNEKGRQGCRPLRLYPTFVVGDGLLYVPKRNRFINYIVGKIIFIFIKISTRTTSRGTRQIPICRIDKIDNKVLSILKNVKSDIHFL